MTETGKILQSNARSLSRAKAAASLVGDFSWKVNILRF
jgi:hypothetical protein